MNNIDSVIKILQTRNKTIKEMKGRAANLKVISGPELPQMVIGKDKVFNLTKESFTHICNLLNIPYSFLITCPPSLIVNNINVFTSLLDERIKWNLKINDNIILSINKQSNLKTISNLEITNLLKEILFEEPTIPNLQAMADIWDDNFQFVLIFNTPLFYEDGEKKKGVFPGLLVTNSEIGEYGVKIDFVVFREPTDSFIVSMVDNKRYFRGKLNYSDISVLKSSLTKQLASFPQSIESVKAKYEKARGKEIKDVANFLEKAKKKYKFDKTIINRVIEIVSSMGNNSLYNIAFAFAKAAREQFTKKKRYDYLCLAGVIINDV